MNGGGKLGREDRILWGKVVKSVRPIQGRHFSDEDEFADLVDGENPIGGQVTAPSLPAAPVATPGGKKQSTGIHYPLEKPVVKKLSRGRLALEARIDLHGMIQSEAHAVLRDFLMRAHERGMRHVLVITGKGNSWGSDGALRRAVPMWFARPDFRYLISSWEDAARNHGGEGALYVRLARHAGEKSGDRR